VTKPALGPDVEQVLRTLGINDADGREFLRTVLPPSLSWAVRGQDLQPVRDASQATISSADNVTTFSFDGNKTKPGEVQIVRWISFQETTVDSAINALEIGVAGDSVAVDNMMRRDIQPTPGQVGYWIGDASPFTGNVYAMLPLALFEGQTIRITMFHATTGTLGGTLKIVQEIYQEPYRGGSI